MISIAFIVSTCNDADSLLTVLSSLNNQKLNEEIKMEVHIADNSKTDLERARTKKVCDLFNYTYHETHGKDCYPSAEEVVATLKADYLCFPSSDGYYVPGFTITMLEVAHRLESDVIYCDCLYDPRLHGRGIYSVLNTFPEMRWIDKTCFIIKSSIFKGFPPHKDRWCDGQLIEDLAKADYRLDKAKGVLGVHN